MNKLKSFTISYLRHSKILCSIGLAGTFFSHSFVHDVRGRSTVKNVINLRNQMGKRYFSNILIEKVFFSFLQFKSNRMETDSDKNVMYVNFLFSLSRPSMSCNHVELNSRRRKAFRLTEFILCDDSTSLSTISFMLSHSFTLNFLSGVRREMKMFFRRRGKIFLSPRLVCLQTLLG